jgi:NAD(P)-dependent dehydrogenase (short-subunit alcohol dehydrogenase family)
MSLNPPIRDWRGKRVWLVGASTGIGHAVAERLHTLGATVIVSARKIEALNAFVHQHPGSVSFPLDVTQSAEVARVAAEVLAGGPVDLVCYCAGHYQPMRATAMDLADMLRHFEVNTLGALRVLDALTPAMVTRQQGHISLISSVAGYSGLPMSLAYGPTKAALINLAETLYADLHPLGLGVSLINPGFVETPLTAHNEFHMPALISSEEAARHIVQGWSSGDFEIHFPRRFTRVMKLLRILPYRLYFAAIRRITGL